MTAIAWAIVFVAAMIYDALMCDEKTGRYHGRDFITLVMFVALALLLIITVRELFWR